MEKVMWCVPLEWSTKAKKEIEGTRDEKNWDYQDNTSGK